MIDWDIFFAEISDFLITVTMLILTYFILTTPTVVNLVKGIISKSNQRKKERNLTKYLSKDKKKEFKKNLKKRDKK